MKMRADHLGILRSAIAPLDTEEMRRVYRERKFPRADGVKDLDKRYRWDLYYAAVRRGASLPDSTNGYTMTHIDTALRAIVAPL
jgi:hypothetical protein